MSGDSALECSPSIGSKRRRAAIGDGDAPATKKSFTDAEIAAEVAHSLHIREQRRAEVRAIYLNYGTLLKGSESGNEALAFQGLLDCANGSLGARRLAARLVPRFLPRFPTHAEQAFRLLSTLYGHGQPAPELRGFSNGKDPAAATAASQRAGRSTGAAFASDVSDDCVMLEEAGRRDALRGLGNVLEAAVRQAERNVPVIMELVLFLMRHLHRLCSTSGGGGASATAAADLPPSKTTGSAQPSPQLQPLPVQPQPAQPQPASQPAQGHHEITTASQGHGLKHRYRRNAEAAANAEANGRSAQPLLQPPQAPAAMLQPMPQRSARNEAAADGCGKIGGADGSGSSALKTGGGDEAEDRGGNGPAAAAGTRIVLATSPELDSDVGVIRSILFRAFCLFPRVVLAACFQPFRLPPKQRGPDDCQACELMLELLLLRTNTTVVEPLMGAPIAGARNGLVDSAGDGVGLANRGGRDGNVDDPSVADGGSAGTGPEPEPGAVGGQSDDGCCLAAQVLAHVPETQAWLRLLAAAMAQGKTQHMLPASVQAHLEQLLLYCTATSAPAAAAPAAAGKVSPRASPQGATLAAAAAAPRDGSANATPARQGDACKPDGGAANVTMAAAQSMVGSDDNSRSVPMDLDHSISTAVRPEGSGAATAVNAAAGAGAAGSAAALAGPPDTAATPAPPPPPLPQHPFHQHHHSQHEASSAAGSAPVPAPGPAAVPAQALPPPLPPPPPPPPPLPLLSYSGSGSSGLRGGPVCRAEACLYIGGLPPGLTEAALVSDLSRLGSVESVHPFDQQQVLQQHPVHGGGLGGPQVPLGEEVYVVFVSLRDAAICYEAVARTCRFGGTRPLMVEFCSAFPADSPAARRCVAAAAAAAAAAGGSGSTGSGASSTASEFVWVSLSAGMGVTPDAVVAALQAAALPVPQQILQVAGRAPGMLLHMASAAIVPQVAACLQAHFTPPPLPPPPVAASALAAAAASTAGVTASGLLPPPPMLGGTGGAPLGLLSSAQSGAAGHYGTPLHMHHAGGSGSTAGPGADPPPMNCRTIWIGQLHESVRDEELLSMCRLHGGDVVGHRILRGSHCAFVDFASQAGAEAAKRALHGARLGPQHIRVEWKLDSGPPPRAPLTLRHASAQLPGAAVSGPVGGGMYGLGPTGPGLAAAPAGPQGMGLLGSATHGSVTAVTGLGMPQQSSTVAGQGVGLMSQAMTPQAVAAANIAAAAAAAAARGAFPGGRSGADRWAPVVIPPPAPSSNPAPTMAMGQGAGGLASAGSGFLTTGQVTMQGPAQQTPPAAAHLHVGPFGTGVINPAVAAVARQAAPMLLAHQQLVAGLHNSGGSGGVMHTPHNNLATPQQGATGFTAQPQPQHLHPHTHASGSSSGGGALTHQTLSSSSQAHAQASPLLGHIHNAGAYPGPPPLHPQQQPSQQQVSMGLPGHSSISLPLHQSPALGVGGPSPQQPQQQQPQLQHAHSHHQTPPQQQQQRPNDWPPPQSHGHSHGMAGGHLGASPGLQGPGGSHTQPSRFDPGSGMGPPLPNSPPLLPDGTATSAPAGVSGSGAGPPHAHPQQQLQQQAGSKHGASQSQLHLNPHTHTHSQNQQQLQQQPPPPPLQYPQQQQPQQQQQQLSSGGSQGLTWQGGLAKSGMHMCTLLCTTGGASAASGATPGEREPVTWPATLDVKLRVDLSYVVHSLYSHTAPHSRALRRLVTSGGPEQRNKLNEFLSYLADKNRAGVIKLEAAAGLPPRTLYLVPPSEQVCAALGAEWSTREPFLLALVVPTAGGTAGGNKGA